MLYQKKICRLAMITAISFSLSSFLQAKAQLGQSDWIQPGQSGNAAGSNSQPSAGGWVPQSKPSAGSLGQSDWVRPGQAPQASYSQQSMPPQNMGQSDWVRPGQAPQASYPQQSMPPQNMGQSDWINPEQNQQTSYQQQSMPAQNLGQSEWIKPGGSQGPFQMPQEFQQHSDFGQPSMMQGNVSQNVFSPQQGQFSAPPLQGNPGGMGGDLSGLGSLGALGGGSVDSIGKAIGAAAQMGLIPAASTAGGGGSGGSNSGLAMPKFGSNMGTARTVSRGSSSSVGRTMQSLPGSRIVRSAANQAACRAMGRLINSAMRF